MNTQLAKLAAEAITSLKTENGELSQKLASQEKALAAYQRREECQKLAAQISERDGITDHSAVMEKAREIDESGEDLRVVTAGLKYASSREFSLGIVAEDKPTASSADDDFLNQLMQD